MKKAIAILLLLCCQSCHLFCTGCHINLLGHEIVKQEQIQESLKTLIEVINTKDLNGIKSLPDNFHTKHLLIRDINRPEFKGVGTFIRVEENTKLADLAYYYKYNNSAHQISFHYKKQDKHYRFTGLQILGW